MIERHPIPAPGFQIVSGAKGPKGGKWWVQLRNGMVDSAPWPADRTRWVHDGSEFDVVAVRRAE